MNWTPGKVKCMVATDTHITDNILRRSWASILWNNYQERTAEGDLVQLQVPRQPRLPHSLQAAGLRPLLPQPLRENIGWRLPAGQWGHHQDEESDLGNTGNSPHLRRGQLQTGGRWRSEVREEEVDPLFWGRLINYFYRLPGRVQPPAGGGPDSQQIRNISLMTNTFCLVKK